MSRKAPQKPDDPEEYARFVKIAEEIQDENAEELFEDAVKKVVKKRKDPEDDSR
jgi:hypothetical protein